MTPFRTTRRVEFGDTDMAGIIHFANFFRYMEAAETDFLRSLGLSVAWRKGTSGSGFPACRRVRLQAAGPVRGRADVAVTVEKWVGSRYVPVRLHRDGEVAVGRITAVYCREARGTGIWNRRRFPRICGRS